MESQIPNACNSILRAVILHRSRDNYFTRIRVVVLVAIRNLCGIVPTMEIVINTVYFCTIRKCSDGHTCHQKKR